MGDWRTTPGTVLMVTLACLLTGCTVGGPVPAPTPAGTAPAAVESLENTIGRFMEDDVTSVVVQVRWEGGEWSRGYGLRDEGGDDPARPQDRFSIASVTKSMVAASVMKLVDDGLIGLDDPVNGVLESFVTVLTPPGPITVRQLLNHTSGMPEFLALYGTTGTVKELVTSGFTVQRGLELTAALPWERSSVGYFAYSNGNYLALAQLIEKLRAKPLAAVLKDDAFVPLGLDRTTFGVEDREASDNLRAYVLVDGERVEVTQAEQLVGFPGGGVVSTVEDVNDFYRALLTGRLVSPGSLAEMKKAPSMDYGLGLTRWRDGCSPTGYGYGHRGSVYGYLSTSISSDDGDRQVTIGMALPTLPAEDGDPVTGRRLDQYASQMDLVARKTLEQLCG
ncbi:serine hydrolase [Paenarthrobacter sp. 4246]|uniref:serine hydrolase domain-containing protein n=1 Tax=Paenarthrobacter sp. 4246 TaxID=3156456 RepID=UPI003390D61B